MDTRQWQKEKIASAGNKAKELAAFHATVSDWYVTCPRCKMQLHGTLEQVKEHSCGS
jgi:hypothetical protein